MLSRIATKEGQMREVFSSSMSAGANGGGDAAKSKLDKMASRIAADYARAEEWSAQKRELAFSLWRKV